MPPPFGPDPIGSVIDVGKIDLDRDPDRRNVLFSLAVLPLSLNYLAEAGERGASARERGGRVGRAEVDAVRTVTEAFNRADETLGGGYGRAAVVQYLVTDVAAYCEGHFAPTTPEANAAQQCGPFSPPRTCSPGPVAIRRRTGLP